MSTYCMSTAQPPPEVSTSISSLHLHLASTSPLDFSFSFFSRLFLFSFSLLFSLLSSSSRAYSSAALLDTALPGFLFRVSSSPGFSRRTPLFLFSPFSFFSFPSVFSHTFHLFFCCLIRVGAVVVAALSHSLTPCEFFSSCDHTPHSLVALLGGLAYQKDHQLESSG